LGLAKRQQITALPLSWKTRVAAGADGRACALGGGEAQALQSEGREGIALLRRGTRVGCKVLDVKKSAGSKATTKFSTINNNKIFGETKIPPPPLYRLVLL
jgi:hypothetical protein